MPKNYETAGVFAEIMDMLRSAKGATSKELGEKMERKWGPTKYQLLPVAEKLGLILHMEKKEGESQTRYRFLTQAQADKLGVEQPAFAVSQLDKAGRMTAEAVETAAATMKTTPAQMKAAASKTPEPKRKAEAKAKTIAKAPAKAKAMAKRKAAPKKKAA